MWMAVRELTLMAAAAVEVTSLSAAAAASRTHLLTLGRTIKN
jgi:hypothetical protein